MTNTKNNTTLTDYIKATVNALDEKKAEDIRILDIHEVSVMADFFIIANGSNINQVHALADNVSEELGKLGCHVKQTEGYACGNWVLMDYSDFIVHIFDRENRFFYDLEHIWRDGKEIGAEEL